METLLQDLRYGFRMLLRTPGFTAVAVITLALGIGANTEVFSIVNALLVRTLPVQQPYELAVVGNPARVHSLSHGSPQTDLFSYPLYRELLKGQQVFSDLAATGDLPRAMVSVEEFGKAQAPESAKARVVTGNFFSVLGVRALVGRTFNAEEDSAPGRDPYVVLSYGYWKRRFNRDPRVLGSTLRVNGYPLTVIGVTPPGFVGPVVGDSQDFWVPAMMQAQAMPGRKWLDDARVSWLLLIGRRKPGVTVAQAKAGVNLVFQQVAASTFAAQFDKEEQDHLRKASIEVSNGGRGLSSVRAEFSRPLLLLMGIVGLVLLIACVNVANLLLARSSARQTEVAVRLAIGASPARMIRQLLTESMLLAFIGGLVAVLLSVWGAQGLLQLVTRTSSALPLDVTPDARVLAFTAAVALLTGILFGLAPALRARRLELTPALKEGSRAGVSSGGPRSAAGKYLVAGQLALSVLVLFTAALLVRSLKNLQELDTGYERDRILLMRVDGIEAGYRGPKLISFALELLERLRRLPGVTAATFSENGLFSGTESATTIIAEGFTPRANDDRVSRFDVVGPDYFTALGIPLLLGRDIGAQDTAASPRVAVINEAFARFYFKDPNPIGRKIYFDDDKLRDKPIEIVGVARDVRDHELRGEVPPRFYIPLTQSTEDAVLNFELRTAANPGTVAEEARAAVRAFDPNLPVLRVRTLTNLVDDSLSDQIVMAKLSSLFAGLALALASVGLYGLISYAVAGRTREIGLRMALGARSGNLLWLVLREVLLMVAIGIAAGIPLAVASSRALRSMLFEITAFDPLSMFGSMLVLSLVALLAAYVPARRATRVDPMVALRYE